MVRDGCGPPGHRALKNELIEKKDFFSAGANSGKLKVISMIFGWIWSKLDVAI